MAAARRTTEAGMLEKRHLDELVTDLMAGGVVPVHVTEGRGVRGCYRRPCVGGHEKLPTGGHGSAR